MPFSQEVELYEYGVSGAVDIDWIGFQAEFGTINSKRFHFIEQNNRRAGTCGLGNGLSE
ncbi:hypothetical protein BSLA_02f1863 [Burkholderia stabilis]|nr:hypothetical protein BSLA_02f1863 [Burkholderia stabilis]